MGQPVAYGTGFLVLVFFGFSGLFGRYFMILAHEGGHMLAVLTSFRRLLGYWIYDGGGGLTVVGGVRYGISNVFVAFAGYAAPPLLGLGGAALIASGNPWAVLLIALLLSLLAVAPARNGLAFVIPLVLVVGLTLILLRGSTALEAAAAVGLVWFLLISGAVEAFRLPTTAGDARGLSRRTLIVPAFVWKLLWIAIGVVALVAGGRLLLVP